MQLIIIKWRDIPTQLTLKKGRKVIAKKVLPDRFMEAVDMAAMRSKVINDDYLDQWNEERIDVKDDQAECFLDEKFSQIDKLFTKDYLDIITWQGGYISKL